VTGVGALVGPFEALNKRLSEGLRGLL
jgi:hypothetical protein